MRRRTLRLPRTSAPLAHLAGWVAGCALLVLLLAAPAARADDAQAAASDAAHWRGRYCTPLGCGPDRGSAWAGITGFGLAVLASARLGRRQRP